MSKENYRSRVHMLLLYPENESHFEAMQRISQSYDYAACLHDRDVWTEEDEKRDARHKAGTFKKEHWHVVVRCQQARWASAICKELGIEQNYIEDVNKFDNALQYLIHYNDKDKAQYTVDEVFGNMRTKLVDSINKVEKSEGEKVVELLNFISEFEGKLSVTQFAKHCAENGYWAEFRRSGAIMCKIIDEHNNKHIDQECLDETILNLIERAENAERALQRVLSQRKS